MFGFLLFWTSCTVTSCTVRRGMTSSSLWLRFKKKKSRFPPLGFYERSHSSRKNKSLQRDAPLSSAPLRSVTPRLQRAPLIPSSKQRQIVCANIKREVNTRSGTSFSLPPLLSCALSRPADGSNQTPSLSRLAHSHSSSVYVSVDQPSSVRANHRLLEDHSAKGSIRSLKAVLLHDTHTVTANSFNVNKKQL